MKRNTTRINANIDTTSAKKLKITKTLPELLVEVSNGQYNDFRSWLLQTNCTSLDLSFDKAKSVNLIHLGQALKGTAVTAVDISWNNIGPTGAKNFAEALKGTAVTTLDISWNSILPTGAIDFAEALKGTAFTKVNLACNSIGNAGAIALVTSLACTKVTDINLGLNLIHADIAPTLVQLIEKTNLLNLELPFSHPAIDEALKRNQEKLLAPPYYIAHLWWQLFDKQMPLLNQRALSDQSTTVQQLQYARGIIMQAPQELAEKIVSYLPVMNHKIAESIFNAAYMKCDAELGDSADVAKEVKGLMNMSIR